MSHQNHYILEFKGRIFSNCRTRKISFNTSTKLDTGDVTVCLRSVDNGKETLGYIKLDASSTDADRQASLHLNNFLSAMQIAGLEFELLTDPKLRWITPSGEREQRIESDCTSTYTIDVQTMSITREKILGVETMFKNLPTDNELQCLASDLKKKDKIPENTAEFLFYWIAFNKIYRTLSGNSERKRIEKYIDGLSVQEISVLYQKHLAIFAPLSASHIIDRNGSDLSQVLKRELLSGVQKEIVKKAVLCVYGLRNGFVHEGNFFNFRNISAVAIFTRDVIYASLLAKYGI